MRQWVLVGWFTGAGYRGFQAHRDHAQEQIERVGRIAHGLDGVAHYPCWVPHVDHAVRGFGVHAAVFFQIKRSVLRGAIPPGSLGHKIQTPPITFSVTTLLAIPSRPGG